MISYGEEVIFLDDIDSPSFNKTLNVSTVTRVTARNIFSTIIGREQYVNINWNTKI